MLTADYERLGLGEGDTVLDLGCGFGRHAFEAARRGAARRGPRRRPRRGRGRRGDLRRDGRRPASSTDVALARRGRPGRRAAPALRRRGVRPRHLLGGPRAHPRRRRARWPSWRASCDPGAPWPITVPRGVPEAVNWALSDAYHNVPGGHIRIYSRRVLESRLSSVGLRVDGAPLRARPAQPLLVAQVPRRNDQRHEPAGARLPPPPGVGHRVGARGTTRWLERVTAPLFGKSLVVYLAKAPRP